MLLKQLRDILRLGDAMLQRQPAACIQVLRRLSNDGAQRLEPGRAGDQRRGRFRAKCF